MRTRATALSFAILYLLTLNSAANGNPDPPRPPQTGSFSTTHSADTLLGETKAQYESLFSPGEEVTWQFYVPPDYRSDRPAGLLVYISPTPSGDMPREWRSTMDKNNIIWIGADSSGNRTRVPRRILLSLLAVQLAQQDYAIDEGRTYLSGFSGGARVASMAVMDHPRIFSGGLFFCGADLWDLEQSPDMDTIRENRYVLVTGVLDQALEPVKKTHRGYRKAGIRQSKLMIIRDMGHSTPRRSDFAKALAFLDEGRPVD